MATKTWEGAKEVVVTTSQAELNGILAVPDQAVGLVVFAHGSGSSRLSPRNQYVAQWLNDQGLATLLFDLLTAREHDEDQRTRQLRFDLPLLSERLIEAVDWTRQHASIQSLPVGLFGASTGAAAALCAAAARPEHVAAVVSRGGRPDLAGDDLPKVTCPTLLIIGGDDPQVIRLNERAVQRMTCEHQTEIVPGATHLFEEPGKLEQVARLASDWLLDKLPHQEGANR